MSMQRELSSPGSAVVRVCTCAVFVTTLTQLGGTQKAHRSSLGSQQFSLKAYLEIHIHLLSEARYVISLLVVRLYFQ